MVSPALFLEVLREAALIGAPRVVDPNAGR